MLTSLRLSILQAQMQTERVVRRVKSQLPEGRPIPGEVWDRRHAGIVKLVWLHAVGLLLASLLIGELHIESVFGSIAVGLLAMIADRQWAPRRVRACLASVGLLASS